MKSEKKKTTFCSEEKKHPLDRQLTDSGDAILPLFNEINILGKDCLNSKFINSIG